MVETRLGKRNSHFSWVKILAWIFLCNELTSKLSATWNVRLVLLNGALSANAESYRTKILLRVFINHQLPSLEGTA